MALTSRDLFPLPPTHAPQANVKNIFPQKIFHIILKNILDQLYRVATAGYRVETSQAITIGNKGGGNILSCNA